MHNYHKFSVQNSATLFLFDDVIYLFTFFLLLFQILSGYLDQCLTNVITWKLLLFAFNI